MDKGLGMLAKQMLDALSAYADLKDKFIRLGASLWRQDQRLRAIAQVERYARDYRRDPRKLKRAWRYWNEAYRPGEAPNAAFILHVDMAVSRYASRRMAVNLATLFSDTVQDEPGMSLMVPRDRADWSTPIQKAHSDEH